MSFTRVKPAGWAFGEILTSAQMNSLDIDHSNSIDKAAGDTCTPTAPIVFKGKGTSVGAANGDDTYFSTANAKWLAGAADFGSGPVLAIRLGDICSYGEGKMLAIGNGANDKIAQSLDDGFSWRDISTNIAVPQTILLACCAAKNATMIAGGNTAKVYYSADAVSWAFITLGGTPVSFSRMHYNAGLDLFIVGGKTAGAPYLATITSGIVGTQRTVPASITGSQDCYSIAEASSGTHAGRMVASWGSQTKVAWSDDGATWTASTTTLTSHNYYVAFGDGVYVALDAGASATAYVSTDGDTWTTTGVTKPTSALLQGFACLNGVFCAVDSSNNFWLSLNKGATWEILTVMYLNYNVASTIRAVRKRLHSLQTDGSNTVNMRSRRLGVSDGTW